MHLRTISAALLLTAPTVLAGSIYPPPDSTSPIYDLGPGRISVVSDYLSPSPKTDCGWHEHCVPRCTKSVNCQVECARGSGFCEGACYGDANTPTCHDYDGMKKEEKKARKKAKQDREDLEDSKKQYAKEEKKEWKKMQKQCKDNWWNWWCN